MHKRAMIAFRVKLPHEYQGEAYELISEVLLRQSHYKPQFASTRIEAEDDEFNAVYAFSFETNLDMFPGWGHEVEDWVAYITDHMYRLDLACKVTVAAYVEDAYLSEFDDIPY